MSRALNSEKGSTVARRDRAATRGKCCFLWEQERAPITDYGHERFETQEGQIPALLQSPQ